MAASSDSLFTLFLRAYSRRNYFRIRGTASRREFWGFTLFFYIVLIGVSFGLGFLIETFGLSSSDAGPLLIVAVLVVWLFASIIPSITLMVRRVHDAGLSGGWAAAWYVCVVAADFAGRVMPAAGLTLYALALIGFVTIGCLPPKPSEYRLPDEKA